MQRCSDCGGWVEAGNINFCSDCTRNRIERRHLDDITERQIEEQKRIAKEKSLDLLKIKLLDKIILSVKSPDQAKAEILAIFNYSIFVDNIEWFWHDVWMSPFLRDIYYENLLQPLFENSDSHKFFDDLKNYHYDPVYYKFDEWIKQHDESTKWNQIILPKYLAYQDKLNAKAGNDIEADIVLTLEEVMSGDVLPISLEIDQAETRSLQVRIPLGVTEGKRIRVPSQGEPGSGGAPPGDLYLNVRYAAHPDFSTEGTDLYYNLNLTLWEAVLGTELSVPTLDGPIKLRIPAGSKNGQLLRVRGRGFPKGKTGGRGDFYASLVVRLPKRSSPEELELWEKLRSLSHFRRFCFWCWYVSHRLSKKLRSI